MSSPADKAGSPDCFGKTGQAREPYRSERMVSSMPVPHPWRVEQECPDSVPCLTPGSDPPDSSQVLPFRAFPVQGQDQTWRPVHQKAGDGYFPSDRVPVSSGHNSAADAAEPAINPQSVHQGTSPVP
ncbi:hypothetical protein, partial [Xenorhabdus mauleonii]|uniref:hypothetical protein n=1 Tax=Xenorhabdus mauleonii TaxID=351675 RepID=UPI001FD0AF69